MGRTETEFQEKIAVEMFLGCQITSDLRTKLDQNIDWKQSQLAKENSSSLNLLPFNNKEYVGHFVSDSLSTLEELDLLENEIKQKIGFYCPDVDVAKLNFIVFPQLFVS